MEISCNKLRENAKIIKEKIGNSLLCAVVKANAYGHGAAEVCKILESQVDMFAVSSLDEALRLNAKKDVLILSGITSKEQAEIAAEHRYIVTVKSENDLCLLSPKNRTHIKVDTGMNRLGIKTQAELLSVAKSLPKLEGIYSHFYADNLVQQELFMQIVSGFLSRGLNIHMASSGSYCNIPLSMCRVGLKLYDDCQKVYGEIIQLKSVKKGETVSYGAQYSFEDDCTLATVKIGYGDGFRRINGQKLKIQGELLSVVGNICMDMCMVIVPPTTKLYDKAYYIDGNVLDIAEKYNTIAYEVLTSIAERVERNYIEN